MESSSYKRNNVVSCVSNNCNNNKSEFWKEALHNVCNALSEMNEAIASLQCKMVKHNETALVVGAIVHTMEEEFEQMDHRCGEQWEQSDYEDICTFKLQGTENSISHQETLKNSLNEDYELHMEIQEECQLDHQNNDNFPGYVEEPLEREHAVKFFPEEENFVTRDRQKRNEIHQEMNTDAYNHTKQHDVNAYQQEDNGTYFRQPACDDCHFVQRHFGGCTLQQENSEWLPMQQQKELGGYRPIQQEALGSFSVQPGYLGVHSHLQNQYEGFPFQQVGYGGCPLMQSYYHGSSRNQGGYGDYPFHQMNDNLISKGGNVQYFQGPTPETKWRVETPVTVSLVSVPNQMGVTSFEAQGSHYKSDIPKKEASVQVTLDGVKYNVPFVDSQIEAPTNLKKVEVSVQVSPELRVSGEEPGQSKDLNNVKEVAIILDAPSKCSVAKLEDTGNLKDYFNPESKKTGSKTLVISLPPCTPAKTKQQTPGMGVPNLHRCASRVVIPTVHSTASSATVSSIAWARPRPPGVPKAKPRSVTIPSPHAKLPTMKSSVSSSMKSSFRSSDQHQISRSDLRKTSTASILVGGHSFSPPRSSSAPRLSFPCKSKCKASLSHHSQRRKRSHDQLGRALLKASQQGKLNDVRCLLKRGANPNFTNKRMWTPLHMASLNCHPRIVSLLLERGADANSRNSYGFSALHMAAYNDHSGDCVSRLIYAGCDLDCANYSGRRPLHFAAEHGNEAAVRALLAAGASKTARNEEGFAPVDVAQASVRKILSSDRRFEGKADKH